MTGGALWRRYVNLSQDMTGTGDYINDPSDCAPPRDEVWIEEYVKEHVDNELNRMSWAERQKNSQALRAKYR
jgi:hypothetical protein